MKKAFNLFLLIFSIISANAQLQDTIYSPLVGSVKFFADDNQLNYPILELNSGNFLQLHFDLLQEQPTQLQYSFIHCSWDWSEDDISEDEFIDGYYTNDILDYQPSFNTHMQYVSYSIQFPNEYVNFKISGNYIIKVFLASNPDSILFQKRFFVVENLTSIDAQIHQSSVADLRQTHQEVDFSINVNDPQIQNAWDYIRTSIYQNFRFDNAKYIAQPRFYQGSTMIYDYEFENAFLGGNEFRSFNSSNFRYQSGKIYKYSFYDSLYYCFLLPDNINYAHVSNTDADGNFVIYNQQSNNYWSENDYVYINFFLLSPQPMTNGNIYVFGALTNWKIKPEFKLNYNYSLKMYSGSALLKQGIYDYQYIFVADDGTKTIQPTEGNFFETQNNYLIIIYYQEQAPYYDRIIGYKLIDKR